MSMSSWHGEVLAVARAARVGGRIAALAGLLGAGLLLSPATARAAEGAAQQAASPARRESPYARYARDHAKTAERKPGRVKPSPAGHGPRGPRGGARAARR
jgi:hypothetical protein